MSSTEEYLDNLLKEALENEEKNVRASDNQANVNTIVNEEPNRALGADEIAALFAEAGIAEAEESVVSEELPTERMEDASIEKVVDPNKALDADEIAALFAEAGIAEAEESVVSEELPTESVEDAQIEKVVDPNKAMDADEIAALFAEAGIAESGSAEAESIEEEVIEESVVSEELPTESVEDAQIEKVVDPNKALNPDEIDALFAEAGIGESPLEKVGAEADEESLDDSNDGDDVEAMTEMVKNEDSDVVDLLSLMSDGDDDLAEIKDLLESSDNNEPIHLDEEELAEMLPEKGSKKKEKKKKEKRSLFGKKKKKAVEDAVEEQTELRSQDSVEAEEGVNDTVIGFGDDAPATESSSENNGGEFADLLSQLDGGEFTAFEELVSIDGDFDEQLLDIPEKKGAKSKGTDEDSENASSNKKKGVIARFFDMLMEEVEEEEIQEIKEKDKDEKKAKKGKKAKKDKKKNKTENEEIMDELDSEDAQEKKGKKKKSKKEKVPKKPMVDSDEQIGKKLPRKMVIRICVLCASILLLIVLISNGIISYTSLKSARAAYYNREYEVAYRNLVGKKLNANDQLILEKTTLIMKVQRKYDSYLNYTTLGNDMYACNALLNGYKLCVESYELAMEHSIQDEMDSLKRLILNALNDSYGISEEMAVKLISTEDTYEYQKSLNEILGEE